MKITEIERLVLQGVVDSEYHDGRAAVHDPVWTWSANPWGHNANVRVFAGAVSSLVKKGWVVSEGSGREAVIYITPEGVAALNSVEG
jgi:hypothetical protein